VSEGIETKLRRVEQHFRRTDQTAGRVDKAQARERGGLGLKRRPNAERLQDPHRTVEKRCGSPVRVRRSRCEQDRLQAGLSQRDRCDEPRRTAADDRDFLHLFHCQDIDPAYRAGEG
jgi:hypothetical protein